MISLAYCVEMARYNAWQNAQMREAFGTLSQEELEQDRGAFFGSIFATVNHLLWGDLLWMSRFDGGDGPEVPASGHATITPDIGAWRTRRLELDARISDWAGAVTADALKADLTWYSGTLGRDVTKPLAACVTHFFNHQTHHRGQVHAMLTAAGVKAPVSDLAFMGED